MISVFFPAGAFGSTIEYCLRNFSQEFDSIEAEILPNGSMHGYKKEFHPVTIEQLQNFNATMQIVTPVYPNLSFLSASETIDEFIKWSDNSKVIFVTLDSRKMIERNWLYVYYKIGLTSIVSQADATAWNKNYKSFNDMTNWEQREWLSFNVADSFNEFLHAKDKELPSWLTINSDDILFNFKKTIEQIFKYLELTLNSKGLDTFISRWAQKQQYVEDESNLIDNILINFQNNNFLEWNPISLMGEAIIQARLSDLGYDFKCYNLNQFPTTTIELSKWTT